MNTQNKIIISLVILSYTLGIPLFRGVYKSGWKYPDSSNFTIYNAGLAEIFAPVVVPIVMIPIIIGEIVTVGLPTNP